MAFKPYVYIAAECIYAYIFTVPVTHHGVSRDEHYRYMYTLHSKEKIV